MSGDSSAGSNAGEVRIELTPSTLQQPQPQDNAATADAAASLVESLLHPPDIEDSVGGKNRCGACVSCHIRESVLRSVEHALHTTVAMCTLSSLIVFAPKGFMDVAAQPAFLLAIVGVTGTGATVGQALVMAVGMFWGLFLSVFAIAAFSLPFFCAPIAHATVWFFTLWLLRYWLSFAGPNNLRSVSAIYMLTVVISLIRTAHSVAEGSANTTSNATETAGAGSCDYTSWPDLLLVYVAFSLGICVCFISAWIPYPRLNFRDAAQLNRRVLRDSTRMIKASLSLLLLYGHRTDERRASRKRQRRRRQQRHILPLEPPTPTGDDVEDPDSDDDAERSESKKPTGDNDPAFGPADPLAESASPASNDNGTDEVTSADDDRDSQNDNERFDTIDTAMTHYVHVLEQLRSHLDDDLTATAAASQGAVFECGGCCCRTPPDSVLTPKQCRDMRVLARIADGFARNVLSFNEEADSSRGMQHGHALRNFGSHSGALYFQYLQDRRQRVQLAVRQISARSNGNNRDDGDGRSDSDCDSEDFKRDQLRRDRDGDNSMRSTRTPLLHQELNKASKHAVVEMFQFISSPDVEQRLHQGFLLTHEQSEEAMRIFETWRECVTQRRRELLMTSCGNVADDFDILGYLGVARMMFTLSSFIGRVSADSPAKRHRPGICKIFFRAISGVTCGAFGIAGGSCAERRRKLCSCGPANIHFLKQSFSSTLAIFLAALITVVPSLLGIGPDDVGSNESAYSLDEQTYNILLLNSVFAPFTIVFIIDTNMGASFQVSILRFFGTVVGAVFGSFLKVFLGDSNAGIVIGLTVWTLCCTLLRNDQRFGDAATVSAYTAAMVVFGDVNSPHDNFDAIAYTLSLVVQTFVGVAVYLVISSVVFPVKGLDQSVQLLDSILTAMQQQHRSLSTLQLTTNDAIRHAAAKGREQQSVEVKSADVATPRASTNQDGVVGSQQSTPEVGFREQLDRRSRQRDKIRADLHAHEQLSQQAEFEFAGCDRPKFHPEYLVAARFQLAHILQLHEILDASFFETMRLIQDGDIAHTVRPVTDRLQAANEHVHKAVDDVIAFNADHQGTNTLTNVAKKSFRRKKQATLCRSAVVIRDAILADEQYLGLLKRLIYSRLSAQLRVAGGLAPKIEDEVEDTSFAALPPSSVLLPLQMQSLTQHSYVMAWKDLQDALDSVLLHLSSKPRFAQRICENTARDHPKTE